MPRFYQTTLPIAALTIAALLPTSAFAQEVRDAPDNVLKDSSTKLDDRINTEKITEVDPPPLPEQVVLPMPPAHRIAANRMEVPISAAHHAAAIQSLERGLDFLRSTQDERGGWLMNIETAPTDAPEQASPVTVAVTALAIKAFAQGRPEWLESGDAGRAVGVLMRGRNEDGSFDGSALANYVTSSVVGALSAMQDIALSEEIRQARTWLMETQWDQGEGLNATADWFGGAGYGKHGRPDLSNTQMMLDALYDSGISPDEPAMQRALAFVSRTQNLKATNRAAWAGNDGGFVYTPANGGESMGSQAAGEGRYGENMPPGQPRSLRSYGSMTYAGFKSMLYAGLSADDVRVRAAFDWIRNNWTFDENPGLGQQGLYYYYHTMSRCLNVAQQKSITDADGVPHNWREELIEAIVSRQGDDGSWTNPEDRWMEGMPEMATIFAVLALEEALKPVLDLTGEGHPEAKESGPAELLPLKTDTLDE